MTLPLALGWSGEKGCRLEGGKALAFSLILVFGVPTHLSGEGLDQAVKVKGENMQIIKPKSYRRAHARDFSNRESEAGGQ